MPLVSVIVPIYNAENYLAACLDSVLAQTERDFELLLVNDGSTDSSLVICRDYEQRDGRVRVFDKPNGGVSSARNMGLDRATGEWVLFIDSDDTITPDTLEVCLNHSEGSDFVRFSFKILYDGAREERQRVAPVSSTKEFLHLQLTQRNCTTISMSGGIYRRRLFVDNNILFDSNIVYGEDWLVAVQLTLCSKHMATIPDAYCYTYNLENVDNCSNSLTIRKVANHLEVLTAIRRMVNGGYRRAFRNTSCHIVRELLVRFAPEDVCDHLLLLGDSVKFITWWDVLMSNVSFKDKRRLWRFLRYCRANGLKA